MSDALRHYQETARDFVKANPRCALLLSPGLGKTAAVLAAIDPSWGRTLIIAPKRVAAATWPEEVERWRPDLSLAVAVGSPAERKAALLSEADLVSIGRETAADALLHGGPWDSIIYDESSGLRSVSSSRFKVARKLTKNAGRFVQMTGTPTPNGLMDIWAQIRLLDGGERLGTSLTGFRNRYFDAISRLPNGIVTKWELKPGAEEAIYKKIDNIALGMQGKYKLDLPELTYNKFRITLPPSARVMYEELKEDMVTVSDELLGVEEYTAGTAAILTSKFSQIASGGIYSDTESERAGLYRRLHDEKLNALREIIEEEPSPVIVFYKFKFEADAIREAFGDKVHGPTGDFVKRWNKGEIPILLSHPASMSHGLNLQYGGHTIVWTSPTFDLELWEQGNARLRRPGQTHPVVVHVLLASGTVDARILRVVHEKEADQMRLLDWVECPLF